MTEGAETIREGEAPGEPNSLMREKTARQEPRPPGRTPRVVWWIVEAVLVVVILGLIWATVLPVIIGRSKNADRYDFLRRPGQQQSRVPRTSR